VAYALLVHAKLMDLCLHTVVVVVDDYCPVL